MIGRRLVGGPGEAGEARCQLPIRELGQQVSGAKVGTAFALIGEFAGQVVEPRIERTLPWIEIRGEHVGIHTSRQAEQIAFHGKVSVPYSRTSRVQISMGLGSDRLIPPIRPATNLISRFRLVVSSRLFRHSVIRASMSNGIETCPRAAAVGRCGSTGRRRASRIGGDFLRNLSINDPNKLTSRLGSHPAATPSGRRQYGKVLHSGQRRKCFVRNLLELWRSAAPSNTRITDRLRAVRLAAWSDGQWIPGGLDLAEPGQVVAADHHAAPVLAGTHRINAKLSRLVSAR